MKVDIKYDKKNNKIKKLVKIHREDTFSLDYTLSFVILPALKKYKEIAFEKIIWTSPEFWPDGWFDREFAFDPKDRPNKKEKNAANKYAKKKMEEVLDKMIFAFDHINNGEGWLSSEHDGKVQEGLELFGKYYRGLWW